MLIDFSKTSFHKHALLDVSAVSMNFPTCWSTQSITEDAKAIFEDEYFRLWKRLNSHNDKCGDHDFAKHLVHASLFHLFHVLGQAYKVW